MKIFCDCCGTIKPSRIDAMSKDNLNGVKIWGDICCGECGHVLCTIEVEEEGVYEFKKVADLPELKEVQA